MSRRRLLWLVLIAGIIATLAFYYAASRDTGGAPALASIDAGALGDFRADFNGAAGQPRLIMLLSPT